MLKAAGVELKQLDTKIILSVTKEPNPEYNEKKA